MPSYRVVLIVGLLHPGVDPERVLPAAVEAAARTATVEAKDVGVVAGEARVTVRYLAADNRAAAQVGDRVAARVRQLAGVGRVCVSRRSGPRWQPVS